MRRHNKSNPVDAERESARQAKKYLKYKLKINKRNSEWRKTNPSLVAASSALYKASKAQRTPAWLTNDQLLAIQEIYSESVNMTKTTGVEYEVDHIVPLRGRNVSGLHVPWNLQVLEKLGPTGNRAKQNKFAA